eukprot:204592-Amphidinium_carterae.1
MMQSINGRQTPSPVASTPRAIARVAAGSQTVVRKTSTAPVSHLFSLIGSSRNITTDPPTHPELLDSLWLELLMRALRMFLMSVQQSCSATTPMQASTSVPTHKTCLPGDKAVHVLYEASLKGALEGVQKAGQQSRRCCPHELRRTQGGRKQGGREWGIRDHEIF